MTIVNRQYGAEGYGVLVYVFGVPAWFLVSAFLLYFAISSAIQESAVYPATLALIVSAGFGSWITLGGIRCGYQCFVLIHRVSLIGTGVWIKTFSRSETELEISDISSIDSFLVKPAISLFSHRAPNYMIRVFDGRIYTISAGVDGTEDLLHEIHRLNPNIEFSLDHRSLRNHWTLEAL